MAALRLWAADSDARAAPVDQSVGRYLDRFIQLGQSRWSPRTHRNYASYSSNKIKPYLGHLKWDQIDDRALEDWWLEMSAGTGRIIHGELTDGRSTTAKVWRFFSQVLRKAHADGLLPQPLREPVARAGHETALERHLLSEQQIRCLLGLVPPNRRVLVLLSATLGLRFGELAGLRLGDIDIDQRTLTVRRSVAEDPATGRLITKDTKTGSSRRQLTMHPQVMAAIESHIEEHLDASANPAAYLIPTKTGAPIRSTNWTRQWRRAVTAAGLDSIRPRVTSHDLRHHALSEAAVRADSHRDLMDFAGHSSPSASLRYIHRTRRSLDHLARGLESDDATPPEKREQQ